MFFEIGMFGKFLEFSKLKIFWIFYIENLLNFGKIEKLKNFEIFFNLENQSLAPKIGNFGIVHPFYILHYSEFLEFSKLKFFRISQIWSFWNFRNWKITKFRDFFHLENQGLASKIGNLEIVYPFDIQYYSKFFEFYKLDIFRIFRIYNL